MLLPFLYLRHLQPLWANEIMSAYNIVVDYRLKKDRDMYGLCVGDASRLMKLLQPVATLKISKENNTVHKRPGPMEKHKAGFDAIQWTLKEFHCPPIPVCTTFLGIGFIPLL